MAILMTIIIEFVQAEMRRLDLVTAVLTIRCFFHTFIGLPP
jgi:hypothetical protein